MDALALEPKPAAKGCGHFDAELLGFDVNASFLRCNACGQVLIAQCGRTWAIRPAQGSVIAIR